LLEPINHQGCVMLMLDSEIRAVMADIYDNRQCMTLWSNNEKERKGQGGY